MSVVTELRPRTGGTVHTVRGAADSFLDAQRNANTRRNYGYALEKVSAVLGDDRPLHAVEDDEIGQALEQSWGESANGTWNARRGAVGGWLNWCAEHGIDHPSIPPWCKAAPATPSETPVRSRSAIDRLIRRRDVDLREKTFYRMLYETSARADEILGVNIEELDQPGRTCWVRAKGAQPKTRRRGATRAEYALEQVWWDAGTARLLPRLIGDRTSGPLFITHRRPGPGKKVDACDVCPDTGLARLGYGQARALLDRHTCIGGEEGTGWDLHEFRHSSLTHLGESGVSEMLFMAKSRHKNPRHARRYFKPSATTMREVTARLGPEA
ncbi:tyrosine-type recombinase/integrase [Streptomyces sp. NPDC001709]